MAGTLALAALAGLAVTAHRQVGHWKTSRTLFEHTLAVTTRNSVIHNNLGVVLARDGLPTEAMAQYREALFLDPAYAEAHLNLGHELLQAEKLDEASTHLSKALRLKPELARAHLEFAAVLVAQGNYERARLRLQKYLLLAPGDAVGESALCFVLQRLGRLDEASAHCAAAGAVLEQPKQPRRSLISAVIATTRQALRHLSRSGCRNLA